LVVEHRKIADKRPLLHTTELGVQVWGPTALRVVILGKAFKEQTNLEVGSPAILLKNILAERGIEAEMYDPWIDPCEDKTVNPYEKGEAKLFFIGTRHAVFKNYKFPVGSTILDPWALIDKAAHPGCRVIHIGRV
jgi:UDP-N-acetyl-D-mannosaminuronate dehydrogenase